MVPKLRSPIVLVHGLLGFDQLKVLGWPLLNYFRQIPDLFRSAGNRVRVARVSPLGGVAERAVQLKALLDEAFPGEAVHLLAHSMGGLDARYMISRLDMADRVLSLTTLGTPHRGTPFADWGIRRLRRLLEPIFQLLGIPRQAFLDLTTAKCKAFNEEITDAPGVRYFSVAGKHEDPWYWPAWGLPARIVAEAEGPNDGLVSVASATYGESCEIWDGNHLALINWSNPVTCRCDRKPDYARLLGRLANLGF